MVTDTKIAGSPPPPAQELTHTMRSALPAPAGTLPTDIEANEALFTTDNTLAEDVDRTIADDVIPAFETKLGNTYCVSRALNGLTRAQTGDPTSTVIGAVDDHSDASLASKLATTAAKASDRFPLSNGILADFKNGKSLEQAVASQGARTTTGAWGTAAGFVAGLGAGIFVGGATSDFIDGLYEGREFEELIRKGLDEQAERP